MGAFRHYRSRVPVTKDPALALGCMAGRAGQRMAILEVDWFAGDNGPGAYLLSVPLALPGGIVGLVAAGEGPTWLAVPLFVAAFGAFFIQNDMWLDGLAQAKRSMFGPWSLRASAWLMFGGAVPQAVRLLLFRRRQ